LQLSSPRGLESCISQVPGDLRAATLNQVPGDLRAATLKSPGTSEVLPGRACQAPGGLIVAARVVQSPRKPSFEAASFEVASFDAPPFDDATFGAASFQVSSFEDATTVLSSRSTGASKVVARWPSRPGAAMKIPGRISHLPRSSLSDSVRSNFQFSQPVLPGRPHHGCWRLVLRREESCGYDP
jgi:hypothetical protein